VLAGSDESAAVSITPSNQKTVLERTTAIFALPAGFLIAVFNEVLLLVVVVLTFFLAENYSTRRGVAFGGC
jgi:hypothetical protein